MRLAATVIVLLVAGASSGGADDGPAATTTTTLVTWGPTALTTRPTYFTATVDTESSAPATGTVDFMADGVSLGQAPVFTRGGHRIAVMGGATLGVGAHTITARYGGDDSHLPSESEPLFQWVSPGKWVVNDRSNVNFTSFSSIATAVNFNSVATGFISVTDAHGLPADVGFYSGTDTPFTLGGRWTVPSAINNAGQAVGSSTVSDGASHAFLFQNNQAMDLGTLGGGTSQALAINNAGQVAGTSQTTSGATHGFLYSAGALADLGTLGGTASAALAIDSSGFAAGYADLPSGERHAAYYTSSWRDLGTLGGTRSSAFAMNDAGQIAGTSLLPGDHDAHAFRWQEGRLTDLAGPDGPPTHAVAMNDAGQVVGWTMAPGTASPTLEAPPARNAFLFSGGLNVLGTLGGGTSAALDISNDGLVVGVSDGRAFVSNGGTLRDLGTLGGPTSIARAINDRGDIVGAADLASGVRHAVIWMPQAVFDLFVSGGTGVVGRSVVLTASLNLSGVPLRNQRIDFTLNGAAVGSAITNARGTAVLAGVSLAGIPVGTYPNAVRALHAASFTMVTTSLVVTPDHPPVAVGDAYDFAGPLSVPAPGVLANDTDADGDALAAVLVAGPAHGTLTLALDGSFTYTPDPGSDAGDAFTYEAVAAGLSSNVVTVRLVGLIRPVFGGVISAVPVTIDDSPGLRSAPRLSGDLLTYETATLRAGAIHYYDFASGQNAVVPRPDGDFPGAPAIDRGRIVFPTFTTTVGLTVFDVASGQSTPIAPGALALPGGATIGGDTVAFTNDGAALDSGTYAWDLPTSTRTRLGNFYTGLTSQTVPRVSPGGDRIVWAACPSFEGGCELLEARRNGNGWTTSVLDTPGSAGTADTDDNWIAYTGASLSSTGSRAYLRAQGTAEDRALDLPWPAGADSIDNGVITLTGGPDELKDIFVYVIATNTLYQVTDDPDYEANSDVSVLPNGDIRVTWLAGFNANIVRAVTFTPGH